MTNEIVASGTVLSLRAWVDALLSGRSDTRVLLVQQNQKDATLLWDEQVVILLDYRDQIIGKEVISRIDAALAAEDESVIDGIIGSLMIVLWGQQPNPEQSLPSQHPKGWPLVWLTAVPNDTICVFSKEELPADVSSIVDWLSAAQRRAQKGEGGLSDTRPNQP